MKNNQNNNDTNTVKSSKKTSLNQKLSTHPKAITTKVVKTSSAINESFDLNSNCFVLGYN